MIKLSSVKISGLVLGFLGVGLVALAFILKAPAVKGEQPELRIFTRYQIEPSRLEPASYGEASEYDYVSYLYSTLVNFDNRGQLISGLAEKFYWSGNDLVFEIRDGVKTSKGDPITAEDVLLSFKRTYKLVPTFASELFAEVCGENPKLVHDTCDGLVAEGNKFVIKFKSKKPLYVDLFTSPDFSVVPKKAYDPKSLKIIDMFNTSGPYRILDVSKEQSYLKLEARKEHWLWREKIPQRVHIQTFFNAKGEDSSHHDMNEMFFAGKFDLVPTYAAGLSTKYRVTSENLKGYNVFESLPISTYIIFFSEKAKAELSAAERIRIGEAYREAYYADITIWGQVDDPIQTREFFPPSSDGSLTDDQKAKYSKIIEQAKQTQLSRPGVLHLIESYMQENIDVITRTHGELTYLNDDSYTYPPNKSFQQRFDGFFSLVNPSSVEGVDSILWIKAMNWMPYLPGENDKWIQKYLETEEKAERISMMKQLHFDMLAQGMIAPLKVQPYTAISRGPWQLKFSKLFSSTPLWQIEYEP